MSINNRPEGVIPTQTPLNHHFQSTLAGTGAPLFDPRRYRATFARAVRSELRKMTSLRSTWSTFGLLFTFAILLVATTANSLAKRLKSNGMEEVNAHAELVTFLTQFYMVFALVVGVLAVTGEYSSNTMRTTVLSTSNKVSAFIAKLVAVTLLVGAVILLLLVTLTIVASATSGTTMSFTGDNIEKLASSWFLIVSLTLMGVGLGYALRSTAGAITLMVVFLWVTPILRLLPMDFFRKDLNKFLPQNLTVQISYPNIGGNIPQENLPDGAAIGVWVAYLAVFLAFGIFRYTRSDV